MALNNYMKISVSSEIFDKVESLHSNFVLVENLQFKTAKNDELYLGLSELFSMLRGHKSIDSHEKITKYEEVLKSMNLTHAEVSTRNMVELIVKKKKDLILKHPIIDAYNLFSLQKLVPIGAYDLDRISGDLVLRDSTKGDTFQKLGDVKKVEVDNSVVFSDSSEVLCNNWVHKQSDNQKIRSGSKYILFRIESLEESDQNTLLLKDFQDFIKNFFDFDQIQALTLTKSSPEGVLNLSKEALDRQARFKDYTALLTRGVSDVIVRDELLQRLIDGEKLKIKHGVDPTTTDLHLGYAVNYEKMRAFQERGHTIQFLIGSFTGRFGDPSDKLETRNMRDKAEVMQMAKAYIEQISKILDKDKLQVLYNGDWYDKMSAEDLLRLMSKTSVARMLERDMFQKRIKEGKGIGLHEIVYPLLQGYDSVEMESDLTIIGTDQTFNELQARPLQEEAGQKPQHVMAMNLLIGTCGKEKMSQSLGNYISLSDSARDKFGKLMSIPDHMIEVYATSVSRYTQVELDQLKLDLASNKNPRDLKKALAVHIVSNYDGEDAAIDAAEHFESVFQKGNVPDDIKKFPATSSQTIIEILQLANLVSSSSEARRLIEQGAVKLDDERIESIDHTFDAPLDGVLKVGKRKFIQLIVE